MDNESSGKACLIDWNSNKSTNIANILNSQYGVATRSGHHCAQPLHRYLGVNASARASLHFYNTKEDVDEFIHALNETVSFFNVFK